MSSVYVSADNERRDQIVNELAEMNKNVQELIRRMREQMVLTMAIELKRIDPNESFSICVKIARDRLASTFK